MPAPHPYKNIPFQNAADHYIATLNPLAKQATLESLQDKEQRLSLFANIIGSHTFNFKPQRPLNKRDIAILEESLSIGIKCDRAYIELTEDIENIYFGKDAPSSDPSETLTKLALLIEYIRKEATHGLAGKELVVIVNSLIFEINEMKKVKTSYADKLCQTDWFDTETFSEKICDFIIELQNRRAKREEGKESRAKGKEVVMIHSPKGAAPYKEPTIKPSFQSLNLG